MNLNSQFAFYPPQPDNPSDADRLFLASYALTEKGWPEDTRLIVDQLSPPPAVTDYANPGEFKGIRVGVLGGGLAGLSAAYELRKLGFDITVYDALDDRIGGRVYTYYFDRQKELYHEFGAMRIPVIHETVWHYINLFHLPTRPFIQYNPNGFLYLHGIRVRNDRSGENVMRYIYPQYNLEDWERNTSWQRLLYFGTDQHLLNAAPGERLEILQVKPAYSEKALLWNRNTNLTMMEAAGLGQDALSLVANFNPLLYGNLYNSFIDFIQESYPSDLSYLYEIPGGMVRLPAAFYDSFSNPNPYGEIPAEYIGKIHYRAGCWVSRIRLDNGGKVNIRYRIVKEKVDREEPFDYIVCALPFSTLRMLDIEPLFSNLKMRAIREMNYAAAQKSILLCRERFWEKQGIAGGSSFTDLPINSVWYPSDHVKYINDPNNTYNQIRNLPWNEPGVMIGSYNFNLDTARLTNQPPDRILEELERELGLVHGLEPGYLERIVEGYKTVNWEHEPDFRGALSFYAPEQKRIFSYNMTQPEYNGRVFFAGEHISAVHRWMQGALQTGMQAAGDLVAACKKSYANLSSNSL